jgi:hypothetical protein
VAANYVWTLPDDDLLLGTDELNLDCLEPGGSSNVRDVTALREVTSFEMLNQMNLNFSYQRYVHIVINGITSASRNIPIYTDSQQPNGEYTAMWFPDRQRRRLFKIDDWFEFDDTPARQGNKSASLENFHHDRRRQEAGAVSVELGEKIQSRAERRLQQPLCGGRCAQFDECHLRRASRIGLRHPAMADLARVPARRGRLGRVRLPARQKPILLPPPGDKWRMLMWDLDFSLGCTSGHAPSQDLFTISLGGPNGSDNMPESIRPLHSPALPPHLLSGAATDRRGTFAGRELYARSGRALPRIDRQRSDRDYFAVRRQRCSDHLSAHLDTTTPRSHPEQCKRRGPRTPMPRSAF